MYIIFGKVRVLNKHARVTESTSRVCIIIAIFTIVKHRTKFRDNFSSVHFETIPYHSVLLLKKKKNYYVRKEFALFTATNRESQLWKKSNHSRRPWFTFAISPRTSICRNQNFAPFPREIDWKKKDYFSIFQWSLSLVYIESTNEKPWYKSEIILKKIIPRDPLD